MSVRLALHPLPEIVALGVAQRLAGIWIVRGVEALDCRRVLPDRHAVDVLRREAHHGAVAVERGYSDFAVGEIVESVAFRLRFFFNCSSGAPVNATPRMVCA